MGESQGLSTQGGREPELQQCLTYRLTLSRPRQPGLHVVTSDGGVVLAEVVALEISDYDPETGALIIQGKGNKERIAYIGTGAADAVREWITVRGDVSGPLFCPVTQTGEVVVRPMTDQAVYGILQTRAARANVRAFSGP